MNKKNKYYFLTLLTTTFIGGCSFWTNKSESVVDINNLSGAKNVVPVVIIGSGPAGLAAGVYTSRAGLHTVIIEGSTPGGLLTETTFVENWPGEEKVMGPDLMAKFKKQDQGLGVQFLTDLVDKVDFSAWPYKIKTADGVDISALSVVVATGAIPRPLGAIGEEKYWSKGVSACAVCDAPFFKNKEVVVVGGGDSAAEQVLQLAPHVKYVTMLVRKGTMRASLAMQQKVTALGNAKILFNREIKEILGDDNQVTNIKLFDNANNSTQDLKIDGVFLAIGHDPASKLFKGQLDMDAGGYLLLQGRSQKTNVQGVAAAGEIADHTYRQAGVAAGEGIKAGLDVISFLQSIGFNSDVARKTQAQYFEPAKRLKSVVKNIKTLDELERLVLNSDKPAVIDFYTDYCASCMHMLPFYESVARQMQGKMNFFKVNADEAEELAEKFNITRVPSFMIYKGRKRTRSGNNSENKKISGLFTGTQKVMTKQEMLDLFTKYIK